MSNSYGRQVVLPLTNKRGSQVIAGDVVVIDTANNDSFTTTTSAGFTGGVGVAQETIANNAVGRVLVSGYAALVNVNASVTRGNFGKTHTVAVQATDAGSARGTGTFCQFLTGGTTPDALVYPVDLLGSSLTNPMTTTGDIIYSSDGSGTPTRLAVGAAGTFLGGGTTPAYVAIASGRVLLTGGDLTQTSTTFADLTGATVTLTTGARRCMVVMQLDSYHNSTAATTFFDVAVDGTRQGGTQGIAQFNQISGGGEEHTVVISYLTAALSAGSHTIKIQWRVSSGTGNVRASSVVPLHFGVMEQAG